jgi:hypothetical protein
MGRQAAFAARRTGKILVRKPPSCDSDKRGCKAALNRQRGIVCADLLATTRCEKPFGKAHAGADGPGDAGKVFFASIVGI